MKEEYQQLKIPEGLKRQLEQIDAIHAMDEEKLLRSFGVSADILWEEQGITLDIEGESPALPEGCSIMTKEQADKGVDRIVEAMDKSTSNPPIVVIDSYAGE